MWANCLRRWTRPFWRSHQATCGFNSLGSLVLQFPVLMVNSLSMNYFLFLASGFARTSSTTSQNVEGEHLVENHPDGSDCRIHQESSNMYPISQDNLVGFATLRGNQASRQRSKGHSAKLLGRNSGHCPPPTLDG